MTLLDAQGRPSSPTLDQRVANLEAQTLGIINGLQQLVNRIELNSNFGQSAQQQLFELTVYLEYTVKKLEDKNVLVLDDEDFNQYRAEKISAIREARQKAIEEQQQQQQEQQTTQDINLDE